MSSYITFFNFISGYESVHIWNISHIIRLKFEVCNNGRSMEGHQNCSIMGNNYSATLVGMLNNSKNNPEFEKVLS
jgi:hypothetical protein